MKSIAMLFSILLMCVVLVACNNNGDSASEATAAIETDAELQQVSSEPETDTDLKLVGPEADTELEEANEEPEQEVEQELEEIVLVGYITSMEGNRLVVENISGDYSPVDDMLIVYYDDAHLFEVGDKVEVRCVGMTMSIPAQAVSATVERVE